MADTRLTDLPIMDYTDLGNDDLLYIVDNGTLSKAVKLSDLKTFTTANIFPPVYLFDIAKDVEIVGDYYQLVNHLITPVQQVGTYEIGFSLNWHLSTTSRSMYYRVSYDDGITWDEFTREPKDTTDQLTDYYAIPYELLSESAMDVRIEVRKEQAGDTLIVNKSTITWSRKL